MPSFSIAPRVLKSLTMLCLPYHFMLKHGYYSPEFVTSCAQIEAPDFLLNHTKEFRKNDLLEYHLKNVEELQLQRFFCLKYFYSYFYIGTWYTYGQKRTKNLQMSKIGLFNQLNSKFVTVELDISFQLSAAVILGSSL